MEINDRNKRKSEVNEKCDEKLKKKKKERERKRQVKTK